MPFKTPGTGQKQPAAAGRAIPARGPVGRAAAYAVGTMGELLYRVGFNAEYIAVCVWRALRNFLELTVPLLAMVAGSVGRWFASVLRGFFGGLAEPFTRYKKRRGQVKRARERFRQRAADGRDTKRGYAFFGMQVAGGVRLAVTLVSYLLPAAAAVVMGITVYNVLGMEYGLAVEIEGQVLGYVTDQTVVDGAKGLLRDRIQLASGQSVADWKLEPTFTLAKTEQFTSTNQLANEILRSDMRVENDITQATGVYLDNRLYAVTTEGARLREFLDNYLEAYRAGVPEGTDVSFVRQVVCEPERDDIFFTSSVVDYDELVERLSRNVNEELRASADGVKTLSELALGHGLTLETLLLRNPQLQEGQEEPADVTEDYVPPQGTELLIRRAQPFLQVQAVVRRSSVEPIPFEEEERESPDRNKGVRVVVQEGVDGEKQVWDDYYYINGELDRRQRIEEETVVLSEPVTRIVEVGTKEIVAPAVAPSGVSTGGGGYVFPVPESPYSSRGIGPNHRGMDINAATGASILACSGGVVTVAEYHYSYGNYIVIDHGGVTTLYAHCSALYVAAGQEVGAGQVIAAVGSTGNSSGPHCHLEIRVGGDLVDPVGFVGYPY